MGPLVLVLFQLPPQATTLCRVPLLVHIGDAQIISMTSQPCIAACNHAQAESTWSGQSSLGLTNCLTAANGVAIRQHHQKTEHDATSESQELLIVHQAPCGEWHKRQM